MKSYLLKKIGQRLGVIRAGMPKEVYFEAVLKEVTDEAAVFELEGGETALPLDKLLVVSPPEGPGGGGKPPAGFSVSPKGGKK